MALPPRVFFSLYEVSFRWECSVADIAGWASQGKLKIMTGIGLVRCGDATVAGPVTLSPMDLLPLFRRSGPSPTEGMVQRIMPDESSDWLIISDPAGGNHAAHVARNRNQFVNQAVMDWSRVQCDRSENNRWRFAFTAVVVLFAEPLVPEPFY